MLWELVLTKISRKINITFGRLEGSRITKRWIWALFSDEMEKGKKFS